MLHDTFKRKRTVRTRLVHGRRRTSNFRGAVNFLPEISNRAGEKVEKLPEFPIPLSENLPE